MRVLALVLLAGLVLVGGSVRAAPPAGPAHALSMYGDLKYGPDFTHFDYVNPEAPRGGEIRLAAIGTFAAGAACGLALVVVSGWRVVGAGVASVLAGYF